MIFNQPVFTHGCCIVLSPIVNVLFMFVFVPMATGERSNTQDTREYPTLKRITGGKAVPDQCYVSILVNECFGRYM